MMGGGDGAASIATECYLLNGAIAAVSAPCVRYFGQERGGNVEKRRRRVYENGFLLFFRSYSATTWLGGPGPICIPDLECLESPWDRRTL